MYLQAIKKYFGNEGRAKHLEYWVVTAICIVLYCVEYLLDSTAPNYRYITEIPWYNVVFLIPTPFIVLAYWLLYLSTALRRCTDIGISRWCVLLTAVPYVSYAFIILLGLIKTDAARTPAAQAKIKKVMSLFKSK